jgi:hypothetical protein
VELQLLVPQVAFVHEALPCCVEHATRSSQVVPHVVAASRWVSQPLSELSSQLTVLEGHAAQAPAEQVWVFLQATAGPHWPTLSQGATPLPEQFFWPGPQTPVQLAVEPDSTQVLLARHVVVTLELRPLAAHFLTSCP